MQQIVQKVSSRKKQIVFSNYYNLMKGENFDRDSSKHSRITICLI